MLASFLLGLVLTAYLTWTNTAHLSTVVQMLLTVTLLSVLEISLSFDNAVVNATVLKKMDDVWKKRFLTWGIAIAVLNNGLRPFLAKWHPVLQAWEARRPMGVSPKEHEVSWTEEATLRSELAALRGALEEYANALAVIAGVEE
jgi:hypothetical protein